MDAREQSRSFVLVSSRYKRVPVFVMMLMPIDTFGIDASGCPIIKSSKSELTLLDFCERYKPVVRKGAIKPVQIMTERRQGNKKIEWFDHVLTVSAYYDFEKVLAATV